MGGAQWTSLADLDVEEILYFIAVESGRPETAERVGQQLRDAVDEHLRRGRPGHRHPSMPSKWRYLKFKRWLIAYEPVDEGMIVHRVVDAVRDLPKQFESGQ